MNYLHFQNSFYKYLITYKKHNDSLDSKTISYIDRILNIYTYCYLFISQLNSSLTNKADKAVIETAPSTVSNGSSVTIPTSCRNAKVVVLYFYRYGFVDVGIITTIGIPWTNNIKCIGNRNITLKSNADNPTSFTVTTSNTDAMNLTFVRLA